MCQEKPELQQQLKNTYCAQKNQVSPGDVVSFCDIERHTTSHLLIQSISMQESLTSEEYYRHQRLSP
jgi:hypothetical protein